jgi:NAD(P)-dependent dehydrogenase (short-subunit alcohol dehydrogenase family)
MDQLKFDGRTAIVTGAGGNPSLGRAHALLLASRGANVVVNDIGRTDAPNYPGDASAQSVAEEIRAAGGRAMADSHSVADEQGAAAVVRTALEAFGSIDILVNNAGISLCVPFDEMSSGDTRRHVDINLMGTTWMCRAAWPHMREQGYGRIVNTGSGAFAGQWGFAIYGASKGGVFSLTRALAVEGEAIGIKVNTVHPGGFTRMLLAQQFDTSPMYEYARANLPAELVSPAVAFLAHESCPVSGECFDAMGGEMRRVYIAQTPGIHDPTLTIESIASRWDEVMGAPQDTVLGLSKVDSAEWHVRPYDGTRT